MVFSPECWSGGGGGSGLRLILGFFARRGWVGAGGRAFFNYIFNKIIRRYFFKKIKAKNFKENGGFFFISSNGFSKD